MLFFGDDLRSIDRPTDHDISGMFAVQELIDFVGFGFEFQGPFRIFFEKLYQIPRKQGNLVQSQALDNFAGPDAVRMVRV